MHLGFQVACGTNGGRAPQTSLHHRSRCSHLNIKARHAQVPTPPTARRLRGFLAASAAFFNNMNGPRLWK